MQTVLDNMNEGVQLFDKDFNVEFVNRQMLATARPAARDRRARRTSGYRRAALHGQARRLRPGRRHREDRPGARRTHPRSERQPPSSGAPPAAALVEFNFIPACRAAGMLAVGHDVTEVKQREEALRAAADILKLISTLAVRSADRARQAGRSRPRRLCEADGANIFQRDGEDVPRHGEPRLFAGTDRFHVRSTRCRRAAQSLAGRTVLERARSCTFPMCRPTRNTNGAARGSSANTATMLGVPLMREGVPIGVLAMTREQAAAVHAGADRADRRPSPNRR